MPMPFYCPDCGSFDRRRGDRRGACHYFDDRPEEAAAGIDPPCALYEEAGPGRRLLPLLFAAGAVLLILFGLCGRCFAHDAPAGWAYDASCCSGQDCRLEPGKVSPTPDGWRIEATGEVIPFNDHRIRDSKDGDFHRCLFQPGAKISRTRCLYVPAQGS